MEELGFLEETEFEHGEEYLELDPEDDFAEEDYYAGEEGEYFYEDLEEGDEFLPLLAGLAPVLAKVAPMAISALSGMLRETEESFDYEEGDTEDELAAVSIPGLTEVDDAVGEALGAEAAETESELEAAALAGAAAAKATGKTSKKVKKVTPTLVKASAKLTRALRKVPGGRKIVKVVPTIQKKTVAALAKKALKGKPVSKKTAVRVMAKQAKRILKSPKKAAAAIKKNTRKKKKITRKLAVARAEKFF